MPTYCTIGKVSERSQLPCQGPSLVDAIELVVDENMAIAPRCRRDAMRCDAINQSINQSVVVEAKHNPRRLLQTFSDPTRLRLHLLRLLLVVFPSPLQPVADKRLNVRRRQVLLSARRLQTSTALHIYTQKERERERERALAGSSVGRAHFTPKPHRLRVHSIHSRRLPPTGAANASKSSSLLRLPW